MDRFKCHKVKAARIQRSSAMDEAKPATGPEVAAAARSASSQAKKPEPGEAPREIGGPSGPEPTRYGDWERKGICVDF